MDFCQCLPFILCVLLSLWLAAHTSKINTGVDRDAEIVHENEAVGLSLYQIEAATSQDETQVAPGGENETIGGDLEEGYVWFPLQDILDKSRLMAERFPGNGILTSEDFRRIFADIATGLQEHDGAALARECEKLALDAIVEIDGREMNCSDVLTECPDLDAIYSRHSSEEGLLFTQLSAAIQEAALSLGNPSCWVSRVTHKGHKPTLGQAWGYGLGFVILVAIISNVGALLTPIMDTNFFQRLLQFLVAMGAGTLAATGLLVLIPEAFDIVSMEEIGDDYIWKAATALISIYVFFVSERLLKFALQAKEQQPLKRDDSFHMAPTSTEEKQPMTSDVTENGPTPLDHGHSHFATPGQRRGPVSTVAWMVMIGDVIHNFVDGMAIGAAFTENTYLGVSISIAVLCEELPHELSDVAILLHSGLTMKRALVLNFLSACVAFIGLVVGIVLGENTTATRWVLAIAGGLFLYVPLCDMLPEMSQHLDLLVMKARNSEGRTLSREVWIVLLCQSLGLFIGISIIFIVVTLSGSIEVGS